VFYININTGLLRPPINIENMPRKENSFSGQANAFVWKRELSTMKL
jgi:hypothetical protein